MQKGKTTFDMGVTVKKGEKQPKVEQHVVIVEAKPANVESVDVAKWRSAINAAKAGMPSSLYRLYENLLSDGVLSMAMEKRARPITNSDIVFVGANGEIDPEVNSIIDSVEFENLLTAIIEAKAYGNSVIDIMSVIPQLNIYNVPRRNINLAKKLITTEEHGETGLAFDGHPYIIHVKSPGDPLGYLYKAALYVIYKRGGFGDWAEYAEIFGMPFRAWKYSAYDTTTRDELIKALQMAGSRLNIVVPKEAELDQREASANSDGELFDKLVDRCEKEILIAVLGETMTTVDGSSRAQSETHKEVSDEGSKTDRNFVRRVLNSQVLPVFSRLGLNVDGGKFTFPEQGQSLNTTQKVDIALKIRKDGVPVSDEYIYEVSGVRKPADGETVSKPHASAPAGGDPDPEPGSDPQRPQRGQPGKKKQPTSAIERLLSFFSEALKTTRAPLKY